MTLKSDLESEIGNVFSQEWEETFGRVVPSPTDVGLNNKATYLADAVVLYADLDDSTNMVDSTKWEFSAEIYKTFLLSAARIIKSERGDITAYDGDRIMAIFIGEYKFDDAVRASMRIKWAVLNIIQPRMAQWWNIGGFELKHTVGIDVSDLRAVRTGVRGDNDLVWVGPAANWAAKMTTLPSRISTYITKPIYDNLSQDCKMSDMQNMWERTVWKEQDDKIIYRSNWHWSFM